MTYVNIFEIVGHDILFVLTHSIFTWDTAFTSGCTAVFQTAVITWVTAVCETANNLYI
jgi:hypothetical protein